jgi:hypothetical protein
MKMANASARKLRKVKPSEKNNIALSPFSALAPVSEDAWVAQSVPPLPPICEAETQ